MLKRHEVSLAEAYPEVAESVAYWEQQTEFWSLFRKHNFGSQFVQGFLAAIATMNAKDAGRFDVAMKTIMHPQFESFIKAKLGCL